MSKPEKHVQETPRVERVKRRKRFLVLLGLGFTLLGIVLGVLGVLAWFVLFAGMPLTAEPLPLPPASGKSDLTVLVSQEYANREIAQALAKDRPSVLGVEVAEVTAQFQTNSLIDINIRITALGRRFDFKIKDTVYAKDDKVALKLSQDVRLEGLPLPLGILNGIVDQVNKTVAEQLNQQLVKAGVTSECPPGQTATCRAVSLIRLTTTPGALNADLQVKIKSQ